MHSLIRVVCRVAETFEVLANEVPNGTLARKRDGVEGEGDRSQSAHYGRRGVFWRASFSSFVTAFHAEQEVRRRSAYLDHRRPINSQHRKDGIVSEKVQ